LRHTEESAFLTKAGQEIRQGWGILSLTMEKYMQIDGTHWAGAFAFNAFLSLFPLMILLVTIASFFVDRNSAGTEVITYMKNYIPLSAEMQRYVFDTFAGVISTRKQAGAVAFLILFWSALQCFITLIMVTNRAWGTVAHSWWRLPLKSLLLLVATTGAILLGIMVPALVKITEGWLSPLHDFFSPANVLVGSFIPLLVVFSGLSLFYRFAPRRPARFAHVWFQALFVMVLLLVCENLFVIYLKDFARLNAIYGAFGGIIALLLWVFISGCIFIFGACLCAVRAEGNDKPESASRSQSEITPSG
jgi:YihY family inner membrane protein